MDDDDYDYDVDDYETSEEDQYGVPYDHCQNREPIMRGADFTRDDLLGIEIEVDFHNDYDVYNIAEKCTKIIDVQYERDGSLDDETGLEFIFAPQLLDDIVPDSPMYKWADFLSQYANGWDAGDEHGMHISVNAAAMTDTQACNVCYFVNNNAKLCTKVAGRRCDAWAEYRTRESYDDFRHVTDKYMAASRRSRSRIEIRIFRSSLSTDRIRRNCEFVEAIVKFSKEVTMSQLTVENFLSFIDRPEYTERYRNIRAFLADVSLSSLIGAR